MLSLFSVSEVQSCQVEVKFPSDSAKVVGGGKYVIVL